MTVKIRVWRDEGKEFKPVLDDPDVYEEAIVFRNDSRQLALGHPDGTVSLYDLNATGPAKEVMKLKVGSRPFCLAYHPHLPILAVGTEETGLQLFDQNGKLMHKLLHPSSVVSISWLVLTASNWYAAAETCRFIYGTPRMALWQLSLGTGSTKVEYM